MWKSEGGLMKIGVIAFLAISSSYCDNIIKHAYSGLVGVRSVDSTDVVFNTEYRLFKTFDFGDSLKFVDYSPEGWIYTQRFFVKKGTETSLEEVYCNEVIKTGSCKSKLSIRLLDGNKLSLMDEVYRDDFDIIQFIEGEEKYNFIANISWAEANPWKLGYYQDYISDMSKVEFDSSNFKKEKKEIITVNNCNWELIGDLREVIIFDDKKNYLKKLKTKLSEKIACPEERNYRIEIINFGFDLTSGFCMKNEGIVSLINGKGDLTCVPAHMKQEVFIMLNGKKIIVRESFLYNGRNKKWIFLDLVEKHSDVFIERIIDKVLESLIDPNY